MRRREPNRFDKSFRGVRLRTRSARGPRARAWVSATSRPGLRPVRRRLLLRATFVRVFQTTSPQDVTLGQRAGWRAAGHSRRRSAPLEFVAWKMVEREGIEPSTPAL